MRLRCVVSSRLRRSDIPFRGWWYGIIAVPPALSGFIGDSDVDF